MLTTAISHTISRVAVLSILAAPLTSPAQSPQEVAKRAFDSVVLIATNDARGQPVSLGSGFIVKEGIIATNLHVLEGATTGYAKPVGRDARHQIVGTLAVDETHDLALLKIEGLTGAPLALSDHDPAAVGDSVYAVGNPKGLEGTFSEGIVSAIRTVDSESILQITAPISPGSSGGPVLNARGQVIGVSAATFREGQNLNFAIPVSYLRMLLGAPEKLTPLVGRPTVDKRKSILHEMGTDDTQPVVGSHFLWLRSGLTEWYSFSVRNNLRHPIHSIDALVIFLDENNRPVSTKSVTVAGPIPAMLAARSEPWSTTLEIRALCRTAEIRIIGYEVQSELGTEPSGPRRASAYGLSFDIPGEWLPEHAPFDVSPTVRGSFRIPRAPGETKDYYVYVLHFEGETQKNANEDKRAWAKAFGVDPAHVASRTLNSDGLLITSFELAGRFIPYTEDATPIDNYRMLEATVEGPGGPWFVRAMGPDPVVTRVRDGFNRLIDSIRREE